MYIQCQNWDSILTSCGVQISQSFTIQYHAADLPLPGRAGRMKHGPTPSVKYKGTSATFDKLLHLVGTGASNVTTASEIARAMELDAFPLSHDLKRLANCGTHGANTSNTERDFRRIVRGAYGFNLEPYTIKLTLDEPQFIYQNVYFWGTYPTILITICATQLRPKSSFSQVPGETDPQQSDAYALLPPEVFGAVYKTSQATVSDKTLL